MNAEDHGVIIKARTTWSASSILANDCRFPCGIGEGEIAINSGIPCYRGLWFACCLFLPYLALLHVAVRLRKRPGVRFATLRKQSRSGLKSILEVGVLSIGNSIFNKALQCISQFCYQKYNKTNFW